MKFNDAFLERFFRNFSGNFINEIDTVANIQELYMLFMCDECIYHT